MSFGLKYLRCNIIWCTTNSLLLFTDEINFGSQSEIPNLDLHLISEKQVA